MAEEGDHVNEARWSDHGSEARQQRPRLSRNDSPSPRLDVGISPIAAILDLTAT